jgi:hypothetical protein
VSPYRNVDRNASVLDVMGRHSSQFPEFHLLRRFLGIRLKSLLQKPSSEARTHTMLWVRSCRPPTCSVASGFCNSL